MTSLSTFIRRSFFDKYKNLALAGEMFDGRFLPLLRQYKISQSANYFEEVEILVKGAQHTGQVVIFLDPDTGVEPRGRATDKHVRLSDIRRLACLRRSKDKMIVYQHARLMRKPTWIEDSMSRIAKADWFEAFSMRNHYDPNCASDVCFSVIEKP